MESVGEAELVESFRGTGENRFFEQLYCRTRRKVFSICFRYLRNPEQAEDATHEAFLRAYQRFSTLEGTHFSAWVCRIAANLCLNRIRDELTRERALTQSFSDTSIEVEESAIRKEEIALARQIIQSLKPEHRKVLLLKYVDGWSYQEIEVLTRYSSEQVRSYLQNARRNFRIEWERRTALEERKRHG